MQLKCQQVKIQSKIFINAEARSHNILAALSTGFHSTCYCETMLTDRFLYQLKLNSKNL